MSKKKLTKQVASVSKSKSKDGGIRETVESVAIAFALAFLFKTFQAEAYVIPTGSMAPTLYGRHKELTCPSCQFNFQIGASTELDDSTGYVKPGARINATLCPNCRREIDALNAPVFNGDRIIVNKQVSEFNRFDVVVFKNPEEGQVNYIKRLVGLPGEIIRIRQGNLWMRHDDHDTWEMLKKDDPEVQKDIQLLVYDDHYPANDLLKSGWPERWAPTGSTTGDLASGTDGIEAANAWVPEQETRQYTADATNDEWHWLRYRHYVPSEEDWDNVHDGRPIPAPAPQASLVSDYCGYNIANANGIARGSRNDSFMSDSYWVGDLTLSCSVNVTSVGVKPAIRLELVEGADSFGCVFHPTDGTVEITRINRRTDQGGEHPEVLATASDTIQGAGTYEVSFANVDNRLLLWVDGSLVDFGEDVVIGQNFLDALTTRPGAADTVPCGVAVRGANITVSDLLIQRDIYYRNDAYQFSQEEDFTSSYGDPSGRSEEVSNPASLHRKLADAEAWADNYVAEANIAHESYGRYSEYRLADDEYLMFGDNSPRSKDSRLFDFRTRPRWGVEGHRYAVKEKDLIGKALYVFWPHGVPFLNGGEGFTITSHKHKVYNPKTKKMIVETMDYPSYRFPFYPNVSRMKKLR
jgi:signal peptidase I